MPYASPKRRIDRRICETLAPLTFVKTTVYDVNAIPASLEHASQADVLIVKARGDIAECVASHLRTKGGPRVVILVDMNSSDTIRSTRGSLRFSQRSHVLSGPRGSIRLSGLEGALLTCLMNSTTGFVTRDQLRNAAFLVSRRSISESSLCVHVHNLRNKLRDVSDASLRTIHATGYQLQLSTGIDTQPI